MAGEAEAAEAPDATAEPGPSDDPELVELSGSPEVPEPDRTEPPEGPELPEVVDVTPAPAADGSPAPPREEPVTDASGAIRAAGGLVWSRWGDGRLMVAVVHRPRYDDWSLPKGKANPGETDAMCALREVREETGLSCALGEDLGSVSYQDRKGRPKTVRYWAMRPVGGTFSPHDEIDQVRWVSAEEARRLLTYRRDAEMVEAFAARQNAAEEPPPSQ